MYPYMTSTPNTQLRKGGSIFHRANGLDRTFSLLKFYHRINLKYYSHHFLSCKELVFKSVLCFGTSV